MYATDYFENKICNLTRGQSISAPVTVYLGLFVTNPGDDWTSVKGGEVTYAGYSRQAINFSSPAASGQGLMIQNAEAISFEEASTSGGSVTHLGVLDSLSGGNMLLYGQLDTALSIQAGVTPVIRASSIKWIFSGNLSTYYRTAIMNVMRGQSVNGFSPYAAFFNGDPSGSGSEFSGNNYDRFALTFLHLRLRLRDRPKSKIHPKSFLRSARGTGGY